jgi:hypothetical protein
MYALPGDIISAYVTSEDHADTSDSELNERQREQHEYTESLTKKFGKFDQGSLSNGAHYAPESPFKDEGLICSSCVFFIGGHGCEVVDGNIEPEGICKLWIIPETLVSISKGRSNIMGPLMRNASSMHQARQAAGVKAGEKYYAEYHHKPEVKHKKRDPILEWHKRRRKKQKAAKNAVRNELRHRGLA